MRTALFIQMIERSVIIKPKAIWRAVFYIIGACLFACESWAGQAHGFPFCYEAGDQVRLTEKQQSAIMDYSAVQANTNIWFVLIVNSGFSETGYECHIYMQPEGTNAGRLRTGTVVCAIPFSGRVLEASNRYFQVVMGGGQKEARGCQGVPSGMTMPFVVNGQIDEDVIVAIFDLLNNEVGSVRPVVESILDLSREGDSIRVRTCSKRSPLQGKGTWYLIKKKDGILKISEKGIWRS